MNVQQLKPLIPKSILDHLPRDFFDHTLTDIAFWNGTNGLDQEFVTCGQYYEVYYALGKYYQPKSLLEIGVLYGFSSGSIIKGAEGAITYVRGYDIDQYEANSLKIATENVTSILPEGVTLNYVIQNSQDLTELDRSFDMIHIDGEHTYGGKLHDLNLTLDKCKVVIVDDYIFHDFVKQAVDEFVFENKHKIKDHMCLESFRGTYIIEYKDYA